jgi:hypothetical protein
VQCPLQLLVVVCGCRRLVVFCGCLALEVSDHFFVAREASVHILPLIILGCLLPGWHSHRLLPLLHLLLLHLLAVLNRQQQRTLRSTAAAAAGAPQRQGLRRH